jgi:hypothetical protein
MESSNKNLDVDTRHQKHKAEGKKKPAKKPASHTGKLGGSRQGNAGMDNTGNDAHR